MPNYRFGLFSFDADLEELRCQDVVQSLRPKTAYLLDFLLSNRENIVSKTELQEHLWPGQETSTNNLVQSIRELRLALQDSPRDPTYIRTVPGRGYRWIFEPTETVAAIPEAAPEAAPEPEPERDVPSLAPPRRRYRRLTAVSILVLTLASLGWFLLSRQLADDVQLEVDTGGRPRQVLLSLSFPAEESAYRETVQDSLIRDFGTLSLIELQLDDRQPATLEESNRVLADRGAKQLKSDGK